MDFRVGYGEDIHALVPNRKLVLSGTKIPFDLGLEAIRMPMWSSMP
jgi:2C-methyl-D-erythritol 2,4-cyclodiphosphate synthase